MKLIDPGTGGLTWYAQWGDRMVRFGLPPFAFFTALSGALLTFDWTGKSQANPGLAAVYGFIAGWMLTAFLVFSITTFLLTVLQSVIRPSLKALVSKVNLVGENFRTLCDGMMADLASKLAVVPGDETRASLYVHDTDKSFVLCGRYSPNPILRRPGRPHYPDNEGCIAKGWQHGWWFENELGDGNEYAQNCSERYNISEETLQTIPMKSKLFAVQRVDFGHDPIALIVVESMRNDQFGMEAIRVELEQAANHYAAILKAFRAYTPLPSLAKTRGF